MSAFPQTSRLISQDTQHQRLFDLLDQLEDSHADAIAPLFRQLYQYAEVHFSLEEAYMRELLYPGYAVHLEAHNKFREQFKVLLNAQQPDDPEDLHQASVFFLREWLKRHIFGVDQQLEQFVLGCGRQ